MMNHPIRHSHIAVRGDLFSLANMAGAVASSGEDELGPYSFFDLQVSGTDGSDQRIRFAAHEGDSMVHLLAERIENVDDLASALVHAGIRDVSALSISTNQKGMPLRDAKEISDCMAAQMETAVTEFHKLPRKKNRKLAV
jgi:hypothetical protein